MGVSDYHIRNISLMKLFEVNGFFMAFPTDLCSHQDTGICTSRVS